MEGQSGDRQDLNLNYRRSPGPRTEPEHLRLLRFFLQPTSIIYFIFLGYSQNLVEPAYNKKFIEPVRVFVA